MVASDLNSGLTDPTYNSRVVEHFERPRNVITGPADGRHVVSAAAGERKIGVRIEFRLSFDHNQVEAAWFRAYGCPHTIALASWLTERLVGERLSDRYTLDHDEIRSALDLPAEKLRSVLVAEDALRACARQRP